VWKISHRQGEAEGQRAIEGLAAALQAATAKVGIDYAPDFLLEGQGAGERKALPLLKAA